MLVKKANGDDPDLTVSSLCEMFFINIHCVIC